MPQYLLFGLPGFVGALPLESVKEVLLLPALQTPPAIPAILAGFVNLNGEVVAVIDLAYLLGLQAPAARIDQHVIALKAPRLLCLIERVLEIIPDQALQRLPEEHNLNNLCTGWLTYQQQQAFVLNPARLLLKAEAQRLEQLQLMAQARLDGLQ